MLFNSFEYLLFLPIVTFGYFILPVGQRWIWLLLGSCFFYMYTIPIYIVILAITVSIDYFAALIIERTRGRIRAVVFATGVLATMSILIFFKYFNFIAENLNSILFFAKSDHRIELTNFLLPIGLSFHVFQSLAYVIEVYNGREIAEKNYAFYFLYVMFFPQLVAGPIERPQNLMRQFKERPRFKWEQIHEGIGFLTWGFIKKVVIADNLAPIANEVFGNPSHFSGISTLIGIFSFSLQIYFDFSGYSDIAIGSARFFGIDLMKNFEGPYFSENIKVFWRRWHVSLSTWFKDYLYIPLGGNTNFVRNTLIVFGVSGLWHGASWNFIFWGLLHGMSLIFYNYYQRLGNFRFEFKYSVFFGQFITFLWVSFAWIFFRQTEFSSALEMISSVFTFDFFKYIELSEPRRLIFLFMLLSFAALMLEKRYSSPLYHLLQKDKKKFEWAIAFCVLMIVALGNFKKTSFIYFQF